MKSLLTLVCLSIGILCFAQKKEFVSDSTPGYDRIPVYKGCERHKAKEKLMKCFDKKLSKLVSKEFNLKITEEIGLPKGTYRINAIFKIDETGKAIGIRTRSTYPALEQEAIRVLKLMPKMQPGILNGQPVTIPYAMPIMVTVFKNKKQKDK